jgi:hypothetical protein
MIFSARVRNMKFHGEDDSTVTNILLVVGACGVFAYASFSIIAGCLGDYRWVWRHVWETTGWSGVMSGGYVLTCRVVDDCPVLSCLVG